MVLKKGFVFSVDAVISLLLLLTALSGIYMILESTPYSRLPKYDEFMRSSSVLNVVKNDPRFGQVLDNAIAGNSNQATRLLRNLVKEASGKKKRTRVELKVYNSTAEVAVVKASYPANKQPSTSDSVSAVSKTFVYEGEYYGTITLRTW